MFCDYCLIPMLLWCIFQGFRTAFHKAVSAGHKDIVKLFLDDKRFTEINGKDKVTICMKYILFLINHI